MKESTRTDVELECIARGGREDERKEEDNDIRKTEETSDAGCEGQNGKRRGMQSTTHCTERLVDLLLEFLW